MRKMGGGGRNEGREKVGKAEFGIYPLLAIQEKRRDGLWLPK